MKKSTLTALVIAGALILAGAAIGLIALASNGFDWNRFGNKAKVTKEFEIDKEIDRLNITSSSCDVDIRPSEDGNCKVVYSGIEDTVPEVNVDGSCLYVTLEDTRSIESFINIRFFSDKAIVYLPEKEYLEIIIAGHSGSAIINGITCDSLMAGTESGNVTINETSYGSMIAKTTSGEITLRKTSGGETALQTASGNVTFDDVYASDIKAETKSGNIIGTVTEDTNYTASTDSGEVVIEIAE